MNIIEIDKKDLQKAIYSLLTTKNLSDEEIESCIKSWEYAESSEKFSHGYERLGWLIDTIEKKKINPNSVPIITKNKFGSQIKGNKSLGYSCAYKAVDLTIKSAQDFGIGITTMSDCYPTGCMGEYTEQIAENDLIGFVISSSPARVSAHGTAERIFPTLGHSFGFPGIEKPYIYDSSIGALTHGDIQLAKKNGSKLPLETVMTKEGEFTTEPEQVFDELGIFNGIISVAGGMNSHKISGLAGSLELIARLALINHKSENLPEGYSFFMAIDPQIFGDVNDYKMHVDLLEKKIKGARKQKNVSEAYFAGEQSYNKRHNLKQNVKLTEKTFNLLKPFL